MYKSKKVRFQSKAARAWGCWVWSGGDIRPDYDFYSRRGDGRTEAGDTKKRMYTGGCIREMRWNRRVQAGCVTLLRVIIGIAENNLTGELLPWQKVSGRRSKVSKSYALTISEPSFVLDLLVRQDFHSCQCTGKILGGVGRVGESMQFSVKTSIILLLQEPEYYISVSLTRVISVRPCVTQIC